MAMTGAAWAVGLPRTAGVYAIRHQGNGKVYIGSSKNIHCRLRTHFTHLKYGRCINRHLQGAWNIDGPEAFAVEVIALWNPDDDERGLRLLEERLIGDYQACDERHGYNLQRSPVSAPRHSEETKERIRRAAKARKGHYSAAHRAAISAANKGRKPSALATLRLIEKTSKSYVVTDPDGNERVVTNLSQFCRENGLQSPDMCAIARGGQRRNTCRGWKCRKADEQECA